MECCSPLVRFARVSNMSTIPAQPVPRACVVAPLEGGYRLLRARVLSHSLHRPPAGACAGATLQSP
eukprot:2419147-Prymnesium_polylepis.1